jgi:hypothetical protein
MLERREPQAEAALEIEAALELSLVELLVDRLLSPHPSEEILLWIPR